MPLHLPATWCGGGRWGAGCSGWWSPTRRTRCRFTLAADNLGPAILASGSIPFVLQPMHHIAGAPRGAYWDGSITDYHLHLP